MGDPERLHGGRISASALDPLGFSPVVGRGFLPEEERAGTDSQGDRVVMISRQLWERRFRSDENIAGQNIIIDGRRAVIVGLLALDFRFIYGGYHILAPLVPDNPWPRDPCSLRVGMRENGEAARHPMCCTKKSQTHNALAWFFKKLLQAWEFVGPGHLLTMYLRTAEQAWQMPNFTSNPKAMRSSPYSG